MNQGRARRTVSIRSVDSSTETTSSIGDILRKWCCLAAKPSTSLRDADNSQSDTHRENTSLLALVVAISSIPAAFIFYQPCLNNAHYIVTGAGTDHGLSLGALLEIVLVIAGIGTAVTLFPILKRQSEGVALGYVAARVLESTIIVVGIISLLSI